MTVRHGPFLITKHLFLVALLAFGTTSLLGCSGTMDSIFGKPEEEKYTAPRTVEQIYNDAMDNLHAGWYETAAEQFDEVERQYLNAPSLVIQSQSRLIELGWSEE